MAEFPTSASETARKRDDRFISDFGALMHLLRVTIGIGVLSVPWALMYAGVVLGPIFLIFVGILSASSIVSLVKSSRHLSRKLGIEFLDYGDVAFHCFAQSGVTFLRRHAVKAKFVVNFFIVAASIMYCCVQAVFIAQNIRQAVAVYWHNAPGDRVFMVMLLVPTILISLIKHLSSLKWFSSVANLILLVASCIMMNYMIKKLDANESIMLVAKIDEFPIFLGTVFALTETIIVSLPIYNTMRNPKNFEAALYIDTTISVTLYILIGVVGYLAFGAETCDVITMNLPVAELLYDGVRIFSSFVSYVSFALQMHVLHKVVWSTMQENFKLENWIWDDLTRLTLVILTIVLGILVPDVGNYTAFYGASILGALQFVFPPLIEILTFYKRPEDPDLTPISLLQLEESSLLADDNTVEADQHDEDFLFMVAKNIFILVIGTVGLIAGTISALQKTIYDFSNYSANATCHGGVWRNATNTAAFARNETSRGI